MCNLLTSVIRLLQMQTKNDVIQGPGWAKMMSPGAGNTKGGSITVPLTSCLTGLD